MMTRVALRRLWFQVHKWIGLALMILLIPLGLSGSLLLADDWLGETHEQAVASAPPALPLPASRYLQAAQEALPDGVRVSQLAFPRTAGAPVTARGFVPGRGPQSVALDARTAQPQAGGGGGGGVMRMLHRFHGSLLVPGVGRSIVGWLGVAMLLSCLTGLWLWWPSGRWLRGLRWRRTADFNANLHHVVGFWIALPLAMLSLSGAWIAFPSFFSAVVGEPAPRRPGGAGGPPAAPRMSIDQVAIALGDGAPLRDISLPSGDPPRWTATLAGGRRVALHDATGQRLPAQPPQSGPVMRFMREVHEGAENTGTIWRVIVFLGGIAPAALGITGIVMWLRTRGWRGDVARRKRERQLAT